MDWLSQRSIQDNRKTEGKWETFAAHRTRLTELLRVTPNRSPLRLCVLGAGNCNDLDLHSLLSVYEEIHLVDLDTEALGAGTTRQGLADSQQVHRHGGIDLTGVMNLLETWSPTATISETDLASCANAPTQLVLPMLPGPFDVVASTGVLSQLLRGVVLSAQVLHPKFVQAIQTVRAGHLRLLSQLVAEGGCGLFITDLVSSETYPSLRSVPESKLSGVLGKLVQDQNFFHGLNPTVVATFFRSDPVVAPMVSRFEMIQPWLWDFDVRVYGVYGLRFFTKEMS